MSKKPFGLLPPQDIGTVTKRISQEVINRYLALGDLSSTISDALDQLGIVGAIPAAILKPTIADARVVGNVVTVRNDPNPVDPITNAKAHDNGLKDLEAHHLADPGDVVVYQGVPGPISNVGGICSAIAHRQGEAGIIIDGYTRDVASSRATGLPIWALGPTPITGKWRGLTVEINKSVVIQGIRVTPGDLVVADETGVCFIPNEYVDEVLRLAEATVEHETETYQEIRAGIALDALKPE